MIVKEPPEVTLEDLREVKAIYDNMFALLTDVNAIFEKLNELDTRVTKILAHPLRHPETRKKIRIPIFVKDFKNHATRNYDDGYLFERDSKRYFLLYKRYWWLKKVLAKHFNEDLEIP
ncbi:MAG: hypothetical protein ACFFCS_16485 [Candidatus Hodarchaeota archaeon]